MGGNQYHVSSALAAFQLSRGRIIFLFPHGNQLINGVSSHDDGEINAKHLGRQRVLICLPDYDA